MTHPEIIQGCTLALYLHHNNTVCIFGMIDADFTARVFREMGE